MSQTHNPYAFPAPGDDRPSDGYGMELRDYFAAKFLAGATASPDSPLNLPSDARQSEVDAALAEHWASVARAAYIAADAMLAARTRAPKPVLDDEAFWARVDASVF